MTSGGKCVFPSLDFKINQIPQQLLFPESKINFSGAEGGARVLVGGPHTSSFHGAGGSGGQRRARTGPGTHAYGNRPGKTPEAGETHIGPESFLGTVGWGRGGGI